MADSDDGGSISQTLPTSSEQRVEERNTLSLTRRARIVAAASAADMIVNFPLWIAAKRLSAGLSLPSARELYKGSGSLYLAMGPMTVIADGTTSIVTRALHGVLDPTPSLFAAASVSGAAGAVSFGAQVENLIVRAHSTRSSIWKTTTDVFGAGGLRALALPPGLAMIVAREVPYCGCLFFLSDQVRRALRSDEAASASSRVPRDMLAASLTACVAGPISHVPSVIAAHQQAHAVSLLAACAHIRRTAGARGFCAGLVPRTVSLAGSLFVLPFSIEALQTALGT
uniref:Mitochondrial carrier protein n=1 Tax=Calcidiscus leptoporus TaxID=127549 RepID=A0A7S0P2B5_9EUKA|mmetsp:Transcript_51829/g.119149  ORF Transcript_51829/g.119149 Transcript_51829/m.119149 type:complete len:284 (+) Transcript_51829:20-871(+)